MIKTVYIFWSMQYWTMFLNKFYVTTVRTINKMSAVSTLKVFEIKRSCSSKITKCFMILFSILLFCMMNCVRDFCNISHKSNGHLLLPIALMYSLRRTKYIHQLHIQLMRKLGSGIGYDYGHVSTLFSVPNAFESPKSV